MRRPCIVVANSYRARVLFVRPLPDPTGERRLELVERRDLVNPASRMADEEIFASTETGARSRGQRADRPMRSQPTDDHREDHERELDRRFAEAVVAAASEERDTDGVVVIAGPRFLGELRDALSRASIDRPVREVAKDLTGFDLHGLREKLVADELLPADTVRP